MTAPQHPSGPPTAPPGAPPKGEPPRRRAGLAVVASFAAVLIALLSLGVAGWAVHRANQAVDAAGTTGGGTQPTESPAPDAAIADPDPTADAPTEPVEPLPDGTDLPPIDPEAEFTVGYENIPLNVQVNSNRSRDIDLDEPSVDADADITLEGETQATMLRLSNGVTAAVAENSAVTPKECLSRIKLSALDPSSTYPLRKGQAFCVLTSPAAAQQKGETRKIVVLGITGISDDREVTISATAYVVPR